MYASSALLISSKFTETFALSPKQMSYCCDNAYSKNEIIKAEQDMMETLDFNINDFSTF